MGRISMRMKELDAISVIEKVCNKEMKNRRFKTEVQQKTKKEHQDFGLLLVHEYISKEQPDFISISSVLRSYRISIANL